MTLTAEQLQTLSLREATAAEQTAANAQRAAWALWASFAGWYSAEQVAALARQTAAISQQGRQVAGNLGMAYMREVLAGLRGAGVPTIRLDLPDARLGADLEQVYSRPAEAYKLTYALTEDPAAATKAAQDRLTTLVRDDLLVARRDGEHQQMKAAKVEHYRRIVHPERSKTGVCGLCLAAADRVYTIAKLLPIHDDCKCTTAPDGDAAAEVIKVDLEQLYKDAGGTTDGRALKQVRYQVNEHGELGPVLGVKGQNFQRRGEAPKGDPIERARKELAALEPVLASLERRSAAGEDVAAALAYQVNRVTKLRAIAA
ncbi:MAG: hypothetical protein HOV78_11695 [Hamadaea sp.]|nr:hypothetical protein [Hamadaea sp.]